MSADEINQPASESSLNREIEKLEEAISRIKKIISQTQRSPPGEAMVAEIPELVKEIVKYLQPLLTPYEAAYYWHIFSKTVIETKRQETILSIRGLCAGVVWPSRASQATEVPQKIVSGILASLESKGVITRMGETTRLGTPYRVNLPEQIEECRKKMMEASKSAMVSNVDLQMDFYNIKENRLSLYERDGYKCYKCGNLLTRWDATLDHILPVSRGGRNNKENLITCCLMCNSKRRNKEIDIPVEGTP